MQKLKVDLLEAYRYLGCRGEPDNEMRAELDRAAALVLDAAKPRFIEKRCRVLHGEAPVLSGTSFSLTGRAAAALLRGSESCCIFCATLGAPIDLLIRQWELRDMAFAATLDACASSAVESLCNSIEAVLRDECAEKGLFLTDRFSPGYEDLPLSIQKAFCSDLDTARKIGVTVTESGLLLPRKSVTALVGIADKPQKSRVAGCKACAAYHACKFRENGVTCYGHIL